MAKKRKAEAENKSQTKKENELELSIEEQITKKTVPWLHYLLFIIMSLLYSNI
jgi:hypothetical protein